jgi:hypothetical protein
MKKLIVAAFALTTVASAFAQGTVAFANRFTTGTPDIAHIYGPSSTSPTLSLIGFGAADTPAGVVNYAGSGMALIGASGSGGKYGYATTFAQLIGADGSNAAESSLVPVGQTTTFRSGTGAGFIAGITSTLSGTPPVSSQAPFATFEIVAWDNSSGQYSTWSQASVAWLAGTIAAGKSAPFNVSAIGGGLITPPNLNNMGAGVTSFNLYMSIPEPSSFALVGLGAAAMMIFRRRK